jgi:hypothetical protein
MNVCVVITIAVIMLLRDLGPYGIIFMTICFYYFDFPVILVLVIILFPYRKEYEVCPRNSDSILKMLL